MFFIHQAGCNSPIASYAEQELELLCFRKENKHNDYICYHI